MLKVYKEPYIEELRADIPGGSKVKIFIKREDVIHPAISGNKWHKLKYNLKRAREKGFRKLLTFGGAYSNHIFATASAAHESGFKSIGVIRGEKVKPLNPTLEFAVNKGMHLYFISREQYREKEEPSFFGELKKKFGDFYILPEGGSNDLAVKGCMDILRNIDASFDYICCPVGTGGTLAGLIAGPSGAAKILGYIVLKGGQFLHDDIKNLLKNIESYNSNWSLVTDYHFGGYAKYHDNLISFINDFKHNYRIPLDPVYTGKMFYGIIDQIKTGYFPAGSRILIIHTGGLQGIKGFNRRFGNLID